MIEVPSPKTGSYGRSHSEGARDRAERQAREKALEEFRKSPAVREIDLLNQNMADLFRWRNELHGRGGITVNGTVIEFIQQQAESAAAPESGPMLTVADGSTTVNDVSSLVIDGGGFLAVSETGAGEATLTLTLHTLTFRCCTGGVAVDYDISDAVETPP